MLWSGNVTAGGKYAIDVDRYGQQRPGPDFRPKRPEQRTAGSGIARQSEPTWPGLRYRHRPAGPAGRFEEHQERRRGYPAQRLPAEPDAHRTPGRTVRPPCGRLPATGPRGEPL